MKYMIKQHLSRFVPFPRLFCRILFAIIISALFVQAGNARAQQAGSTAAIWPEGKMPGQGAQGTEMDLPSRGSDVQRITNISNPTLTLYPVFWKKSPSPAMIVFPGGAYSYVAYTREGSEAAEWLNSIGITALVFKYRVPDNREGALQDIQRAISLARANASKWNIDPDRIGVIGFSAGGNLCAKASNLFDSRAYAAIDEVDKLSCSPYRASYVL